MRKAVIYDRASSSRQQDNWSRADALRIGSELVNKHNFDDCEYLSEVQSGESLHNRPVMKKILDDIAEGRIQAIIVQNFSRLSRDSNGIDGLIIKKICKENNCLVITPGKIFDFTKEEDDIISDIQFLFAKTQKRMIIKQSMQGMRERASQGLYMGGRPPFGYRLVKRKVEATSKVINDLEICPQNRIVVHEIFTKYQVMGSWKVTQYLNETHPKPNARWHSGGVLNIVRNPLYAGIITWGKNRKSPYLKTEYTVNRPDLAIVSIHLWERCNKVATFRMTGSPHPGKWGKLPFSGFLKCPKCGKPMYGRKRVKKNYVSYVCKGNLSRSCYTSISHNIVARALIPFISDLLEQIIELALDKAVEIFAQAEGTQDEVKQTDLFQIKQQKENIIHAIADGVITTEDASKTLNELRGRERTIKRELSLQKTTQQMKTEYKQALKGLKSKNIELVLWEMLDSLDLHKYFRQLLHLIFKTKTLVIENIGTRNMPEGEILSFEFTDEFATLCDDTIWRLRLAR